MQLGDDPDVLCEVINACKIEVKFSKPVITSSKDTVIHSLKIGEGSLSLFDEISIPIDSKINSVYKIKKIEKRDGTGNRGFNLYSSIGTKTKQFILPVVSDNYTNRDWWLMDTFFENAYLYIKGIDLELPTEYPLILLYRYSESEIYRAFETRIKKHPLFVKTYDINKHEVLFILDISAHKKDVDLFMNGAYSQLSEKLKSKILTFHNFSTTGHMAQILSRDPALRRQYEIAFDTVISDKLELHSKPIKEEETYE